MALTDVTIKNAKFDRERHKAVTRLADGNGLYLEINPKESKGWRFRYRFNGKQKSISFGVYPEVSLKEARDMRDAARKSLRGGIDPSELRRQSKVQEGGLTNTFEAIAREYMSKYASTLSEGYFNDVISRLERDVFPFIGDRPIKEITAPEILTVVQRIESRGAPEAARRGLQKCGQIIRYAVATGRADYDPSASLKGALAPQVKKHYASISDPQKVAGLLRAIDTYEGNALTKWALQLAPLLFVRPGELRHAEWSEVNWEAAEWRIPAEKMKMREQHIVPLSKQALAILLDIQALTGHGKYVFPSLRSKDRPMSNNTINAALRRMGYSKEEMTAHGFRSMASTLLNEMGWNRDAIERQLAHAERDKVRAAYNFADYLPERVKMMQAWANYLDKLRSGAKVTPIRANAG